MYKRDRNKDVYVLLMGGLGNQLFQTSAAMFYGKSNIYLVSNAANASLGKNGQPEVFDFALPSRVKEFRFSTLPYLTRKLINLSIRMSTRPRNIFHSVLEIALSILISINQKRILCVKLSDDVGKAEYLTVVSKNTLLIGYFQSLEYANALGNEIPSLQLNAYSGNLNAAIDRLPTNGWRFVHVRLGDYFANQDFGLLSPNYFLEQIAIQNAIKPLESLVFTNGKESLREISDDLYQITSRLDHDLTSSELLMLSSLASQYVISNSTFSWWAAFLSHRSSRDVIAPSVWFRYSPTPKGLIPPYWEKVSPKYLDFK